MKYRITAVVEPYATPFEARSSRPEIGQSLSCDSGSHWSGTVESVTPLMTAEQALDQIAKSVQSVTSLVGTDCDCADGLCVSCAIAPAVAALEAYRADKGDAT